MRKDKAICHAVKYVLDQIKDKANKPEEAAEDDREVGRIIGGTTENE